jgi:hypothetical protein
VFGEVGAILGRPFPIAFRVGSIERGRAPFPLAGIVFADVHECLKVSGFGAFVCSDVSGIGFIVSSIGVIQDLVRPVRSGIAVLAANRRVALVGFTVEMLGATGVSHSYI